MKQHTSTSVHFFYLAISGVLFTTSVIEAQHATTKKDKIILCTFFTPSHEDMANKWLLPSIQDDFEIIIGRAPQECASGSFMKPGWRKTTKKKVLHIIDTIENNLGRTMIFADADIQFFGPVEPCIRSMLKNNDIVIQRDNPQGRYCTGFFAHRCNKKMSTFWKQIYNYMCNEQLRKSDQSAFNEIMRTTQIKCAYLPTSSFMGGGTLSGKIWKPGNELEIPNDILMFHANYTSGLEKNEELLKYVKNINNQRSTIPLHPIGMSNAMRNGLRISSSPYITGDGFREYADHIVDHPYKSFNASTVKAGDTIFVYISYLSIFFSKIHPRIKHPYILLTGNADNSIPGKFESYLNEPKLIAWFGRNAVGNHPKIFPLPIGIVPKFYPTRGNTNLIEQIIENNFEKIYLLCMNFAVHTNKKERQPIQQLFKGKVFCYFAENKPFSEYLQDMAKSKFVLSPDGNGIECHRTWEALMVNCIPIVKSGPLDHLYQDLPVLIINNWNEVTEEFLNKKYEEFQQRTFNLDKLYMPYWIDKIEKIRENFCKTYRIYW